MRAVQHFLQVASKLAGGIRSRNRNDVIGLNLIGLKRRGTSQEAIHELTEAFRTVYGTPGNIREIAERLRSSGRFATAEGQRFLEFFGGSTRGVARPRHHPQGFKACSGSDKSDQMIHKRSIDSAA